MRGVNVAFGGEGHYRRRTIQPQLGWCRQQNRDCPGIADGYQTSTCGRPWRARSAKASASSAAACLSFQQRSRIAGWAKWRDFARNRRCHHAYLSSEQAAERGRATGRQWLGGVFSPSDGIADTQRAAPVIARGIMKFGGTVHQQCAARGIETAAGRVSGVVTEKGTIKTPIVVMAGGAWASSFCHQLGMRFPQSSVRYSILAVEQGAEGIPDALHTARVSSPSAGRVGTLWQSADGRASIQRRRIIRFGKTFLPIVPAPVAKSEAGHARRRSQRARKPASLASGRGNADGAQQVLTRARTCH